MMICNVLNIKISIVKNEEYGIKVLKYIGTYILHYDMYLFV